MRMSKAKLGAEIARLEIDTGIRKPTINEEEADAMELNRLLARAMTDRVPSRCSKAERAIASAAIQDVNDIILRARAKIAVIRGEGKAQDITW
ncbi:hypothetical protein KYT24_004363 [Salmonella enterica]|nr:hypothetical protein [Salmonella enterica]